MICLGTNDEILPNKKLWTMNQPGLESFRVNILGEVVQGIVTVLEYVKLLSALDFTEQQCKKVQEVGQLASLHTLNIFLLKQAMLGSKKITYRGIKLHASVDHIHQQILLFGSPRYHDTTRFEHQHVIDGVAAVAQTSQRNVDKNVEMLMTVSYNLTCTLLLTLLSLSLCAGSH